MKELIEHKISQLKSEIEKVSSTIASLRDTIRNARAQCKIHEANASKLSGAVEAFQGTVSHISLAEKNAEAVKKESIAEEVGNTQSA
jgi:phage shock protein A